MNSYNKRRQEIKNRRIKVKYRRKNSIGIYVFLLAFFILIIFSVSYINIFVSPGSDNYSYNIKDKEIINESSNVDIIKQEQKSKERSIDGVSIYTLSQKEAKIKLLQNYNWKMSIDYKGQVVELKNVLEDGIDSLLEDIYINDKYGSFELNLDEMKNMLKNEVSSLALKWDTPATNAQIVQYDKTNNDFEYENEKYGIAINQEKLLFDLSEAVKSRDFDAKIRVETVQTKPKITIEMAKQQYKVIGTYATVTTEDSNRNDNIELASNALNGLIIKPNEEFSFNKTTGNRTEERGYRPAGAYKNGLYIKEPGGGVCQVSSTLYNAVIFSGLTMTERYSHTYEPSYVTPGEDAMVSYDGYDGPDMKFINQSNTSVAIVSTFDNQKLNISIIGIPILEEGVTISMRSEKIKELDRKRSITDRVYKSGTFKYY